jgi:hypothetical protein
MAYDITDAKEDIEKLYREILFIEEKLVEKNILDKPKEKQQKKINEEDL